MLHHLRQGTQLQTREIILTTKARRMLALLTMVRLLLFIRHHPPRMGGCLARGREYESSLGFDLSMVCRCDIRLISSIASQFNSIEGCHTRDTADMDDAERDSQRRATA